MILRLLAGALALVLLTGSAEARHAHHHAFRSGNVHCDDRYAWTCDVRGWHEQRRSEPRSRADRAEVVAHPAGCPRVAFCGCGAAVEVFGKPIRWLWLAANWLKFPHAEPAAGMAAVRQHHVMIIREYLGGGRALVYDANSGRHLTRVHEVSLRGYSIRNPRGG